MSELKIFKCDNGSETTILEKNGYFSVENSNHNRESIDGLRSCQFNEELGCILMLDSIGYPIFYTIDLTRKQLGGVFVYTFNSEKNLYEGVFGKSDKSVFDPIERALTEMIDKSIKGGL